MPKLSEIITAFADALTNAPKEHKKEVVKQAINTTRDTGVDVAHTTQEKTAAKFKNALGRLSTTNPSVADNVDKNDVTFFKGVAATDPNARTAPNTNPSPDLKKTPPTNTPTPKPM